MLLLVLIVLGLGAFLGAAGMRRLGQTFGRVSGPWRPALGGLSGVALIGGIALIARGALVEGVLLILAGLGFAGGARIRSRPKPDAAPAGSMDEREARSLLGVSDTAGSEEIEAAYKRLIRRVHPDAGGAAGLAAHLNRARDVLRGRVP